jgi:hypothetical protein
VTVNACTRYDEYNAATPGDPLTQADFEKAMRAKSAAYTTNGVLDPVKFVTFYEKEFSLPQDTTLNNLVDLWGDEDGVMEASDVEAYVDIVAEDYTEEQKKCRLSKSPEACRRELYERALPQIFDTIYKIIVAECFANSILRDGKSLPKEELIFDNKDFQAYRAAGLSRADFCDFYRDWK